MYVCVLSSCRVSSPGNNTALDLLFVRAVAGNIIPAVLSATAVSAGLASLEVLKLLQLTSAERVHTAANMKVSVVTDNSIFAGRARFSWLLRLARRAVSRFGGRPDREVHFHELMDLYPILQPGRGRGSSRYPDARWLNNFRNSYVNLGAQAVLAFASPAEKQVCEVSTTRETFTPWDFVQVLMTF